MKNIFITGVCGMVGSHLVDYILENTTHKIYGFCRWNESMENIEHLNDVINKKERFELIYGDLNDYSSVDKAIKKSKPDYVFHLGAQSYPQVSFDSPIETLQTNIIGTTNLLESLKNSDYRDCMIHVCSSSEVFGRVSNEKLPIDEDCTFHPASPYAISKVGTDLIGRYYAEAFDMMVMVTRMFTHTGPRRGDVFHESSFAKQIAMIEKGLQEPKIYVGNLESLRTYADVRDAVRAYWLLLNVNSEKGEYYNIGGNFSCTVGDTLNYLISLSTVKNIEIVVDGSRLRPIDADLQVPNCNKFINKTGWKPSIPYEKTMTDLLNYWRKKVNNDNTYINR
jgi:GDPmannose 4,6-dehydratase